MNQRETTMKYLGEDEGALASHGVDGLYEDMDGNLYEWVEGYERVPGMNAWGETAGCACMGDAPDLDGLGALYAAPDGTIYQMQGLSAEEAQEAEAASAQSQSSEGAAPRGMGPGRPGEIRSGPDGHRYRWVRGTNAQGKTIGFWRRIRPAAARPMRRPMPMRRGGALRGAPEPGARRKRRRKGGGGFFKKLLPIAKFATNLIPLPGAGAALRAGIDVASKLIKPRGVDGYDGLGALYAAPDGTVYQMQGIADEELHGFAAGEQMEGFADIDDGADLADDVEGFAAEQELAPSIADVGDDYVGEPSANFVEGYVRQEPPRTRMFTEPTEPPALWKPLW
jgi:hypothetical protein